MKRVFAAVLAAACVVGSTPGFARGQTRKALAISIIAALCSGMAVPASAMPNMPHLFAQRGSR